MFSQMFGLKPGVVSVIGSGGKTTLLSTLARELPGPVILCTTHIFPFSEYPLISVEDAGALKAALTRSRVVCLGQPGKDGKLTAPALPFSLLLELAPWVLVEADGSKHLPLKPHASYEPVVPPEVHRPERFCTLTGAQLQDLVTPELAALAIAREGLARQVFLNQVESRSEGTGRAVCPRFAGNRNPGVCREPSSNESFFPSRFPIIS